MRRSIQISMAATLALALAVPAAVSAAAAERGSPGERALDAPLRAAGAGVEALRLVCGVRSTDSDSVVACTWGEPTSDRAESVRLYRFDPAVDPHRQVVYRSANLATTTFTDTHVRRGRRYAYAVVVVDADDRVVGRSRVEWVRVPPVAHAVEVLKLACALGDSAGWVGCEWSRPVSAHAAVVSLWRSVDGGGRELVERFRPPGPNAFRDAVPADARYVTYVVIASTESDRVVGRSRPVTVRIPQIDVRRVETRRVEARPVGTRPVPSRGMGVAAP